MYKSFRDELHIKVNNWSVGPRRPSEESDAIVAGWLTGHLSIFAQEKLASIERRPMHVHKCQKTTTTCQMSEFGAEVIACPWNQQVHLQFAESLMQKSSKLELFYQIVKVHEFLKYARRSRASKALPLDDLSIDVWSLLCWILGLSLKMWRSLLIQRLSLGL